MRLTRHEIILLVAIVAALGGGALVRKWRMSHPPANQGNIGLSGRSDLSKNPAR